MKANKRVSAFVLAVTIMATAVAHSPQLFAETAGKQPSAIDKDPKSPQWSVQVMLVNPGDVNLSASFQIAIYESLLHELTKTKRFKQVLRDGDRTSSEVPDLLTLKTTVEKYSAGSETQRAVTTVSGATKLTVKSELCTRDGRIVFERTVDGKVLFVGSNLRATHNLARNVARSIEQSPLPTVSMPVPTPTGQL